jgi:hypothetical protein
LFQELDVKLDVAINQARNKACAVGQPVAAYPVAAIALSMTAMAGLLFVLSGAALAQPVPKPAPGAVAALAQTQVQLHPWQAALPRLIPEAYFTNLNDGDTIETPRLVKFGLSGGWGLAPISKAVGGKAGHHHLLVNRDLPLDFKQALPFTDQYIHFGKGQMETVLNLAPGTYKLRLLLADDKHIPHFVYSKPLSITVSKKTTTDPKTLVKPGVEMQVASAASGEQKRPFRVQFHASGVGVAHQAQAEKDTGHFKLAMWSEKGAKLAEMDFVNGQTEVWLEPPVGDYTLRLDLIDNLNPARVLHSAAPVTVKVR